RICRMWGRLPRKAATAAPRTTRSSSLTPSAAGAAAGGAARGLCPAAASRAATRSPRRASSRRTASRAPPPSARSAPSRLMAYTRLKRDQAVLLGRPLLALGVQVLQRPGQVPARVGRLNNIIDQPAAGGNVRGGEGRAVRFDQLGPAG